MTKRSRTDMNHVPLVPVKPEYSEHQSYIDLLKIIDTVHDIVESSDSTSNSKKIFKALTRTLGGENIISSDDRFKAFDKNVIFALVIYNNTINQDLLYSIVKHLDKGKRKITLTDIKWFLYKIMTRLPFHRPALNNSPIFNKVYHKTTNTIASEDLGYVRYSIEGKHFNSNKTKHRIYDLPPSVFINFLRFSDTYFMVDSTRYNIESEKIDALSLSGVSNNNVDRLFTKKRIVTPAQIADPANNINKSTGAFVFCFQTKPNSIDKIGSTGLSYATLLGSHEEISTKFTYHIIYDKVIQDKNWNFSEEGRMNADELKKHFMLIVISKYKTNNPLNEKNIKNVLVLSGSGDGEGIYDKYKTEIDTKILTKTNNASREFRTTKLSGYSISDVQTKITNALQDESKTKIIRYWLDWKRMGDAYQMHMATLTQNKLMKDHKNKNCFIITHDLLAGLQGIMYDANVVIESRGIYNIYMKKKVHSNILTQLQSYQPDKNKERLVRATTKNATNVNHKIKKITKNYKRISNTQKQYLRSARIDNNMLRRSMEDSFVNNNNMNRIWKIVSSDRRTDNDTKTLLAFYNKVRDSYLVEILERAKIERISSQLIGGRSLQLQHLHLGVLNEIIYQTLYEAFNNNSTKYNIDALKAYIIKHNDDAIRKTRFYQNVKSRANLIKSKSNQIKS
jgi:hypothetical protein